MFSVPIYNRLTLTLDEKGDSMTINQLLQKLEPTSPILQANFGIERESLRVDRQGKLAHTPHPSCLGARSFHPYIQTDFL